MVNCRALQGSLGDASVRRELLYCDVTDSRMNDAGEEGFMGNVETRGGGATERAFLLRLVEGIDEYAIFAIDENGFVTSWNPGVKELLGYDREEFIGRHVRMIFPHDEAAAGAVEQELAQARRTGRASDRRRLRHKDGTDFMADGSIIALREGDRFVGYAKIIHSDDERHRLEQDLADVRRQNERFVAAVSHELRTPLMAILGWLRVLHESDVRPEELRTALRIIEHNTLVERDLVEELIDSAKLLAGSLELDRQQLDLRSEVLSEVDAVRTAAGDRGICFDVEIGSEPIIVDADRARVRQVLRILLSNATKYTLERGSVHVEVNRHDGHAELVVSDSGVGIEPEDQAHLFERFRQASGGRALGDGGVGLGLSIAKGLVELHDGEITATSDGPGRGSRFVVRLPIARDPVM